jgi:hypothetical protein
LRRLRSHSENTFQILSITSVYVKFSEIAFRIAKCTCDETSNARCAHDQAREFDVKDEVTEPDPESNPSDDRDAAILEDHEDDPVLEELTSLIDSLSEDEQIDLVALAWLGRDDYGASDWPSVRAEAADAHNNRTANYLIGMPLLGDYLDEGLSMLGYSCEEFEIERF